MSMEAQAYLAGAAMMVARVAVYASVVLMGLCAACAGVQDGGTFGWETGRGKAGGGGEHAEP